MTKPLLTIGIPTWNRCEDLRVAIDSILSQLTEDLYPRVEILVSDNASTDDTQRVLAEYKTQHPDLFSIHRNGENLGFSRNVDMLFRRAKGEFALVLSDDDALEPDAICEILRVLNEYDAIDIMVVLASEYNDALSAPQKPEVWVKAREEKKTAHFCSYYSSGVEYYKANGSLCSVCISGNLFRVSAWQSVDMTAGLESGSVQLHAAVQLHARGSSCIIRRPLVKYRVSAGNVRTGGYESGFPFVYHFDIVEACRKGQNLYPADIYRSFYLTCVRGVFYTLLEVKTHTCPINREYFLSRLDTCFDPDYCGWLIPLFRLLMKMPSFVFVIPHHLYRFGQRSYWCFRSHWPKK